MIKEIDEIIVLITTSGKEEAHKIAELLLNQRKAACVNIVSEVDSLFWWEGKLGEGCESLLIVKTRASLFPQIITLVKGVHSYEVPEIIALPIISGNEDYLKWLDTTVEQ